jgi:hypothetical protein
MALIVKSMARDTPEQGEGGRFQARVTLDDVLDVFETVEGPPVITSSDVAGAFDCSGDTARLKLNTLKDQNRVANRSAGKTTLWWRIDDAEEGQSDE